MMGSRKRSVLVRKDLEEAGYTKEQVQKLHSPIGLAIGAQTPAEIALSVISEIVQCKNDSAKAGRNRRGNSGRTDRAAETFKICSK